MRDHDTSNAQVTLEEESLALAVKALRQER
jgi:hypothetical protein